MNLTRQLMPTWKFLMLCAVDTFQAVLKKYEVRNPALLSGRVEIKEMQKILHGPISKLSQNNGFKSKKFWNEWVKLPPKKPIRQKMYLEQKLLTKMMNFWVKKWIRQQFSWSRPVKEEEGRRDVFFNTWDVREERREGSRWWTWVSLYISPSLCEVVGNLLISEHRTVRS